MFSHKRFLLIFFLYFGCAQIKTTNDDETEDEKLNIDLTVIKKQLEMEPLYEVCMSRSISLIFYTNF